MSNQQHLIHIDDELDAGRRQTLGYMLSWMAAVALNPSLASGLMAQSHAEHAAGPKKKYRPLTVGKPTFFSGREYKILTRMVDLIIPRTATPGAADAGVPLYIDIVAGGDTALGERLRQGLAGLGKRFASAKPEAQIKILESMLPKNAPGNEFFESVKAMTIVGYYSSEIGLYEELHFVGNQAVASFTGCTHGGHSLTMPRRTQRASLSGDSVYPWPFPSSDHIAGDGQ